jgi:putrescine transport system substrate-binding protein
MPSEPLPTLQCCFLVGMLADSHMPLWRISISLILLFSTLACSQHHSESTTGGAPGAKSNTAHHDPEKVLNIYNWTDYIAPDTIANFERETGIKVRYDTYESAEVMETKLLTGHSSYDIVIPTGPFFERELKAGVYRQLDKKLLPNLANLDPEIMSRLAKYDPNNLYAVPYLWSTTGLGYNVDEVRARLGPKAPNSWALIFDPSNAAKLKDCGILMVDSPLDVVFAVLIYLGRDPSRFDPQDIIAASAVLKKVRPFVRIIETAGAITDLANGSVCLSLDWSGDVLNARERAKEASNGIKIAYFIPQEGSYIFVDTMGIPADAPHPLNAHIWMNYVMRPDVIADITNHLKYPNGNSASTPFVQDAIKNDRGIYPDSETRSKLLTIPAIPTEYTRLINREWTNFRTGY